MLGNWLTSEDSLQADGAVSDSNQIVMFSKHNTPQGKFARITLLNCSKTRLSGNWSSQMMARQVTSKCIVLMEKGWNRQTCHLDGKKVIFACYHWVY
jgi:hypothetical protein